MERTVLFPHPLRFFNVKMSSVLSAIFLYVLFLFIISVMQLHVLFVLVDVPVGIRIAVENVVYVLVAPAFYVLGV